MSEENKNEVIISKQSLAGEQLLDDPAESGSNKSMKSKKEEDIQLSLKVNLDNNYLLS